MKLIIHNRKFLSNAVLLILLGMTVMLSACEKTIFINEPINQPVKVTQRIATRLHPSQFYLCGNAQFPCRKSLVRSNSNTFKDQLPYSFNQQGAVNEKLVTQRNSMYQ